jgi:glycosyltransferase involved in cell wall biosynthesis
MTASHRFAILAPNFHPRTCGVGDYSVRLGAELRRRGFEVSIHSRSPVEPHPEAPDLPVFGDDGRSPLAIARGLLPGILARRPTDLLIQYTSQMWDAWRFGSPALPWLAAKLRRAGVRVTLVAHEPYIGFGGRADLVVASALQRAQFAALLLSCDHSFVTTESRLQYIAPYCRALRRPPPGVLRVGANALPLPRPAHLNGRARVGVFSTAAYGKRFDVVIGAFERLARDVPAVELVLIGDLGPPGEARVAAVTEAARRSPAMARIRITGKLTLPDVAREMADLDVYLFPMVTGANTRSGTLSAALGSGLPTVAVHGIETDAALFRDGENVSFARELSAEAFAAAALPLLRDHALAGKIGAGARALYDEHLTWERIADRLLGQLG